MWSIYLNPLNIYFIYCLNQFWCKKESGLSFVFRSLKRSVHQFIAKSAALDVFVQGASVVWFNTYFHMDPDLYHNPTGWFLDNVLII